MPVFVSECHLLDNLLDFCLFSALTAKMPQYVRDLGGGLFIFSSTSDIRNSKLEESTRLMCSTGLLMHDLIIDFDK